MWTKREDSILKEEISKSPNNLAEAFRCAARRLKNKSYAACSARWYYVLSKQDKVFSLESDNSSVVNTKNGAKQSKSNFPEKESEQQSVEVKEKGIFLNVPKLEQLSINFLKEIASAKIETASKKELIDIIVE